MSIPALSSALTTPELFRTAALIDGKWCESGARFDVHNPSNGDVIAQVADCGGIEAQTAIEAAARALPAWRARSAADRGRIMRRWFELILAHRDDLARLLTTEQGKPYAEARGEVTYGASFIEWFAEEARRAYGDVIPSPMGDRRLLVIRQPVGVCAAITPWNFPIAMVTRKLAPALAAGCTVVIKPAEQTPLCALALGELAMQAGIPAGVLNIIPCSADGAAAVGGLLCDSPVVRHLSFTGSTEIGRLLMRQCAGTLKRLALELGGHAPFIVFEDADLDAAVEGAIASKYRNAGQTCVCSNRFIVHRSLHAEFVRKLVARVADMKVGDGFASGVEIGPLIDDAGAAKVLRHVEDALASGATLHGPMPDGSRFVSPVVLNGVTSQMLVAREETFGPVAPVMGFDQDDEAIALANASEFGLAAYFYSRDIGRIWRAAEALEYGMVGINTGLISHEVVPFGGIKQSGFGREGSKYGLDEYLDMKYLCMAGI